MKKILLLLLFFSLSVRAEDLVFPEDAAVDVTKAPYFAKGDGIADDTAAIQKALDQGQHLVYLPNGSYLVSNGLRWGKLQRRTVLQGQSRDGVVVKLKDECPGFNLPGKPLPMFWTGKAPPVQRYRNGIRNLTIDTGRGNPGAIGVQFTANDEGTIDTVRIRCGDTGPVGLDLAYTPEQGPCLITRLEVVGFDKGIATAGGLNGITFEDIRLEGQQSYGMHNSGQSLFVRNLESAGRGTALQNAGKDALAVLIDVRLTGTGNAPDTDAVFNGAKCALYARHLESQGYRAAIKNDGGHEQSPLESKIGEWFSHPPLSLFPAAPHSLGLPVKETPETPWDPLEDWASAARFSPKKGDFLLGNGRPIRVDDWTDAIQQAIDSGKSTIYFPKEGMQFNGAVHVRGKVRRLVGCEQPWGRRSQGTWIVDDGVEPVLFERFDWSAARTKVQQSSNRALVVKNVMGGAWEIGKGAGDTFFSDVSADSIHIGAGSSVWARQLNVNNKIDTKIVNDGGTLWILGLTTVGDSTQIESSNGARTQVDGCLVQANSNKPKPPCFIVRDSNFSVIMGESAGRRLPYADLVMESRGGTSKTLKNGDTPSRAGGSLLTLFSTGPVGDTGK